MKSIIYVKILNEDINVWKPINAILIGENTYEIIDEDDEIEFKNGEIVKVKKKIFSDKTEGLIAYKTVF